MVEQMSDSGFGPVVSVKDGMPKADILIVCEHASARIPPILRDLGLPPEHLKRHIAWDPGALGVASSLAEILGVPLVHGEVSRLVYDCNRPPEAMSAVPLKSEAQEIPGNIGLTPEDRMARVTKVYEPFRDCLAQEIRKRIANLRLLVTVHSFTPVYLGQNRTVELGILHGRDPRFATAMIERMPSGFPYKTMLNEPYSAKDGVAHTLDVHGTSNGLLNVMLEIRNDLILTEADQKHWADSLAPWLTQVLAHQSERQAL